MADKVYTGNTPPLLWSQTANWNGSTAPSTGDIVFASGKTIIVDQTITVGTITTAAGPLASAGGTFSIRDGSWTLNTNISAGTTTCLTISGLTTLQTTTINGSVYGGVANVNGISKTSGGTLNIVGDIYGGASGNARGIDNNFSTAVNITGNCYVYQASAAIVNQSSGQINILGNLFQYTQSTAVNINTVLNTSTSSGTINITGNCYNFTNTTTECYVVNNLSTSSAIINIIGDVYGNNIAIFNNGSSTISLTGNLYSFGKNLIKNAATGTINIRTLSGITQSSQGTANYLIDNAGTNPATINIISNISGSSSLSSSKGIVIRNSSTGIINLTGNTYVNEGNVSSTLGLITNASTGRINIFGDIYGGSGQNGIGVSLAAAGGILSVSGNVYGGSNINLSPAIFTTQASGSISITGNCIAGTGYPAIHSLGSGTFLNISNGNLVYTNGINPIYSSKNIQVRPTSQTPLQSIIMTDTNNNNRYFLTTFTANTTPFSGNVLNGTIYSGYSPTTIQYTGSCIVPPSSAVTLNVPVRDNYGIASGMTVNTLTSIISSYIL